MRGRRARTRFVAAGLDDDDGLVARRRPRGRHELARRVDRFDVEQDRARVRVAAEVVEQVAEVHVGRVAERDEVREPDAAALRVVEHRGRQRAGLGNERERARARADVREACIEPDAGHQQADAVGAEDPQAMRARRLEHAAHQLRSRRRRRHGRDHDGRAGAAMPELVHQARQRRGRGADDSEIRRRRQLLDCGPGAPAGDRPVPQVDRPELATEAAGEHIADHRRAHAAGTVGCADHGDRGRTQQLVEVAGAHAAPAASTARPYNPGCGCWTTKHGMRRSHSE